jgi:predicted metal-binding membrane protein
MDAGPGTDLGGLGWYLGIWVTMTAAMMLPSAVPAARHVARVARRIADGAFHGRVSCCLDGIRLVPTPSSGS